MNISLCQQFDLERQRLIDIAALITNDYTTPVNVVNSESEITVSSRLLTGPSDKPDLMLKYKRGCEISLSNLRAVNKSLTDFYKKINKEAV